MKKKKAKAGTAPKKPARKKPAPKKKVRKPRRSRVKISKPAPRKKAARRAASKKAQPPKPGVIAPPNAVLLGYVEDYYARVGVAALTLEKRVSLGDRIHVLGHTTHYEQTVDSLQIDHRAVSTAGPQAAVGIKVTARARRGDHVYLIP